MTGLVPVIHVVVQLYHHNIIRMGADASKVAGNSSGVLALNHVDGRDEPGHDGVDRFDYFAASPKTSRSPKAVSRWGCLRFSAAFLSD